MATIEELRAKLLANAAKGKRDENSPRSRGDNASYPFWDIPVGSSVQTRFLPDGDPDNTFFWVERQVIKLPFEGVVGGDYPTSNTVQVTVPCVDMFGMSCPIIAHTKKWWKTEKEEIARIYWKKRSYIFQGFVVGNSPVNEEAPENPIRKFVINKSIYDIIYTSLVNPEFEDMPTDYVGGRDFKIAKTQKGEWANYGSSTWSFKTRSLSENEQIAIDQFGLFDLKESLGQKPDADGVEMIKQMFLDSLDGKPFDHASYGHAYRAFGGGRSNGGGNADTANEEVVSRAVSRAPVAEEAPVRATATPAAKANTSDILQKIKDRTLNKG